MSCFTTILADPTKVSFYPLMRELGIYLDLISCNFVLLIKLLPYRSRASLTAAFAEASRLTVAFGAGLVGCSMLREFLIRRTLFANVQLLVLLSLRTVVGPDSTGIPKFVVFGQGAFILLDLLITLCGALGMRRPEKYNNRGEQPVEHLRVTGRLTSGRA